MFDDCGPFFGLEVDLPLVIEGTEQTLRFKPTKDEYGRWRRYTAHTIGHGVYDEFTAVLLANYPGLPDYRTLSLSEVRRLYRRLIGYLKRVTAP